MTNTPIDPRNTEILGISNRKLVYLEDMGYFCRVIKRNGKTGWERAGCQNNSYCV